ncbi:MAG: DNA-directed DNA polymerase II small subunit [Nanoarchaeota archaeon]
MNKKEIVEDFLGKSYLVSPCFLESFDEDNNFLDDFSKRIRENEKIVVLNKDLLFLLKNKSGFFETNWFEFEKSRTNLEKGKDTKIYDTFLKMLFGEVPVLDIERGKVISKLEEEHNSVIVKNFLEEENKKREVDSFVNYFRTRYDAMKKILMNRAELQNVVSINRVINKKDRDTVALIGLVNDKRTTKNGNIILNIEDKTGSINIIVNKTRERLFKLAKDLVLDEILGVVGFNGEGIVFVTDLFLPDVPRDKEIKKINEDIYLGFISDIHVGGKNFLEKEFLKFIDWLNGKCENKEHIKVSSKIKYLFVLGDLVDGVGVYPDQEKNLAILDVKAQYDRLAYYFSLIRGDIKIIVCPGNHDALRLSVPQPILDKDLASEMHKLKNVILVTNPAWVNVISSENFPGFDILMYHGNSFHYYIDNVDSLRLGNARDYPTLVSKFLLQRRHLAPTHGSTLYLPNETEDHLIIDKIPDIFACGEMHRSDIGNYNNIILINSSCWQSKTDYEEKVGTNPDPGKFIVLNLRNREVNIFKFYE